MASCSAHSTQGQLSCHVGKGHKRKMKHQERILPWLLLAPLVRRLCRGLCFDQACRPVVQEVVTCLRWPALQPPSLPPAMVCRISHTPHHQQLRAHATNGWWTMQRQLHACTHVVSAGLVYLPATACGVAPADLPLAAAGPSHVTGQTVAQHLTWLALQP